MKLNALLKMLDEYSRIVVWNRNEDDTPLFDGLVFDFPHSLWKENYDICKDLDDGACGISLRDSDDTGKSGAILVVSVKKG